MNKYGEGSGHGLDTCCGWITVPSDVVGDRGKAQVRKTQRNMVYNRGERANDDGFTVFG